MSIVSWCCSQMQHAIDDPDIPIDFIPKFREIGVSVLDGGDSLVILAFCPWCGHKLPVSLRARWFDELEGKGIDPHGTSLPVRYLSEEWYQR